MTGLAAPERCARLAAQLERTLDRLVPRDRPALLVGSGITNVGDAAIAVATHRYLAARGTPVLDMDRRTYDAAVARRFLGADGTLLLAGGGTFGDVWPSQAALRARALADLAEVRAVQLPQTVHYTTPAALDAAAPVFRGARRLTLLLRDHESVAHVRARWGLEAILAPDLAFLLRDLPAAPPTQDVLWLLRTDQESVRTRRGRVIEPPPVSTAVDWPAPRAGARRTRRWLAKSLGVLGGDAPRRRAAIARRDHAEEQDRLATGLALIGSARVVATDRLHASIFALLLGRPVVVMPDRHGKLRSFHHTWTADVPDVTWCETYDEGRAAVAARRAASG